MQAFAGSRWIVGPLAVGLTLAVGLMIIGGCVQHVNYSKQMFEDGRWYNVKYQGPEEPMICQDADHLEIRFDEHVVKVGKEALTFDQEKIAIAPDTPAVELNVTDERIRILVSGHDLRFHRH